MYKIVYGVPTLFFPCDNGVITDYVVEDDEYMYCDFELDYYPDDDYYKFEFETMLGFETKDGARNWIIKCWSALTDYMKENGYDTTKECDLYDVFTKGINVTTKFKTIEDAYAWLKMMVFGFYGQGMFTKIK